MVIARQEHLPLYFLSTIFQNLAKEGMLRSRKGATGGFQLGLNPRRIRLLDVVNALERTPCYAQCAMGYPKCSNGRQCPMHGSWKSVRGFIRSSLQTKTIAGMAALPARFSYARRMGPSARDNALHG